MKTFVRTLWEYEGKKHLWDSEYKRLQVQKYLNTLGFYVLTGLEDSLDVYVIENNRNWTEDICQIILKLPNL